MMIGLHQRESHSCSRGITASPYSSSRPAFDSYQNGRSQPAVSKKTAPSCLLRRRTSGRCGSVAVGLVLLGRVDDAVGLDERLGGAQPDVCSRRIWCWWKRAMSLWLMSISEWPWVIHSATARPTPGPSLIQTAAARPQPPDLGVSPRIGMPSQVSDKQAVDGVADLGTLGPEQVGHQLEGLLELRVEVVLGERHLGRRELGLLDRGDVLGLVQDRAVGVGADLHVGAVLALVAEGVHVAHDREGDLALLLGQLRARADGDHLVHRGGQRDGDAGHVADLRAPHAAGDHDGLGLDVAAGRCGPA